ncbi:MAG: hypothetical protein LCI00_05140 [Chloroflexi bacterium]|nr:hypothetical protein [Chloroflexota bacterium]MCC6896438.1 hypothetical protein [Anaerolineae bacterium]
MKTLRHWQIGRANPYCFHIAADARLSLTDYHDDQIWEVVPGSGESPALALQTRLGGRAGLVSIVPMWFHDGRSIYQAQAFTRLPHLTRFAPSYLCFEAALTPQLGLRAEYWVMDSHAVGIRFTLANNHAEAITIDMHIIAFIGLNNKEQRPLPVVGVQNALALGKIGNLQPIVLLDKGLCENEPPSSVKLKQTLTIEAGKTVQTRVVHAGLQTTKESAALAQKWLDADWKAAFSKIEATAQAIPNIETGDADTDATIAFAYRDLVQGFLKATASLPHGSFVATREPGRGYNTNDKGWSGQTSTLAYLSTLGIANVSPALAQGVLLNYLAVQQDDGWIDNKPGLGGQKQGVLCMPILARLAWSIFQYTEDSQFLRDAFPKLQKFFERWLQPDLDRDGDGLPEWQHEAQTGYVFTPTFAAWQAWGEGANIQTVESPDLIAYLLSEAKSLREIAYYLRDEATEQQYANTIERFETALEQLWNKDAKRFAYRDRDSHLTLKRVDIIKDARAMDELLPAEKINPPNRLVVHISGGVNLQPKMTLKLDGFDSEGKPISESASGDHFIWAGGRGVYTSQQVFSQIDRVHLEGLSRVYRVDVHTMDTTRLDINAVLPLWSAGLPAEHMAELITLLKNPDLFWRASGVSMNAADDANYDPRNALGSGGVWLYWLTLVGEALIEAGDIEAATDLIQRILGVQTQVLKATKRFSEFYHSDESEGLGEPSNISGIVPVHLLTRVLGVRIISARKVWIGGRFVWGKPVTIQQHGVVVERNAEETKLTFPNGVIKTVSDDNWQEVTDANA